MPEYLSSFNAGQLSPLLDSRSDLDVYQSGCKNLRNFYVKPQGGVERRQGTHYLLEAIPNSRLIPFTFTRDTSFIIEISDTIIRILDGDGVILETLDSPYDIEDIQQIKYTSISDVLRMVCPNKKPYQLKRTNINPVTFEIEEVPFTYPPLLERNLDPNSRMYFKPLTFDATLDYSAGTQVTFEDEYYVNPSSVTAGVFDPVEWSVFTVGVHVRSGSLINLYSDQGEFHDGIQDGYFRVSHQRSSESLLLEGSYEKWGADRYEPQYSNWVYIGSPTDFVNMDINQEGRFGIHPHTQIEVKDGVTGAISVHTTNTFVGSQTIKVVGGTDRYCRLKMNTNAIPPEYVEIISYSIKKFEPVRISFTSSNDDDTQSDELDVSFSNWTITTSDKWTGSVEIERSTDGGGIWNTITKVVDTAGMSTTDGETSNVTFTSPSKEGKNTKIRIIFHHTFGTIKCVLENDTIRSEGLLRIKEYIDDNNVVAEVINSLLTEFPTSEWNEGAFNSYRGYPTAITELQNRIIYSGTIDEPNTVYMSYVDDYNNFLMGTDPSDPIKVTPNTNEPTNWLLTKSNILYQGTRGSVVTYSSYDNKAITPTNVSAVISLTFGGSTVQGILSNETVVFLERLNLKLREAFYSDEESGLVSRDLTSMSNEIAGDFGFTELVLQKTPDQIIYGLREDGLLAGLTYERSQDVIGWSVFDFGGDGVSSIAVRPTGSHDELWIIVKRLNGTFIEKTGTRLYSDDLKDAWYVDSGITQGGTNVPDIPITIGDAPDHHMVFSVSSDIMDSVDNDMVINVISTDEFTPLDGQSYQITDVNRTNNTFIIKHNGTDDDVNGIVDFMPSSVTYNDIAYDLTGYNDKGYPIFESADSSRIEGGVSVPTGNVDINDLTEIETYSSTIKYEWFSSTGSHYCKVTDINNDDCHSIAVYSLPTPYDTSTKVGISSIPYDFKKVCAVCLTDDGTRLYISFDTSNGVYQYDLDTPWMLAGRSNPRSRGTGMQITNMQWNRDGTKLMVGGYTGAQIWHTAYMAEYYEDNPIYHNNPEYLYNVYRSMWMESFPAPIPWNKKHTWSGMFSDPNTFISVHITEDGVYTNIQQWATEDFTFLTAPVLESEVQLDPNVLYTRTSVYGGTLFAHLVSGVPASGTTGVYNIADGTVTDKWTIESGTGVPIDSHESEWFYPPKDGWNASSLTIINYDVDMTFPITSDVSYISKLWTGLEHLEGETVHVQGDGCFAGTYLVENGSITTDEFYSKSVIGLKYISMIQPMFISSSAFQSAGYNKNILSTVFRFYRTLGGYSGIMIQTEDRDPVVDFEELSDKFPEIDRRYYDMEPLSFRKYNDPIGSVIKPFTGTKEVNFNDTSSRVKTQFIITDDPLPMTVQSMAVDLKIEGD